MVHEYLYNSVWCADSALRTLPVALMLSHRPIHYYIWMKSTKVQNPRCIPRVKPIMRARLLATHRGAAVAASCIVWDKAEPAIRTILHDALIGQNIRMRTWISPVTHSRNARLPRGWVTKLYACALLIIDGLGHATWSSTMPVSRSRTAPF